MRTAIRQHVASAVGCVARCPAVQPVPARAAEADDTATVAEALANERMFLFFARRGSGRRRRSSRYTSPRRGMR